MIKMVSSFFGVTVVVIQILVSSSHTQEKINIEVFHKPLQRVKRTQIDVDLSGLNNDLNLLNQKSLTNVTASDVENEIIIDANTTKKPRRRKGNGKKRRRRNRRRRQRIDTINSNSTSILRYQTSSSNSTSTIPETPREKKKRRKNRRRKNRKNRRKHKLQSTNILEVTTAKSLNVPSVITSNTSLNELIQRLNNNPEDNFDNLIGTQFSNQNSPNHNISPNEKSANLVKPISIPGFNSSLIHLHVDYKNNSTRKGHKKKKNRCSKNKGGCSQICKPKGKQKCACFEGFILNEDNKTCEDLDECKIKNGGCQMTCKNTLGSYECQCSDGLRLSDDSKSCHDINECLLRNGHGPCQDTCNNMYGSYICSCAGLAGTKLSIDNHTCIDLNECETDNNGCSHNCINTLGKAYCSCPLGMELSSDWKTCTDINECEDESISKTCQNGCINTEGSYKCVENSDMQNDDSLNALATIVCPPLFPPEHGFISCSRDGSLNSFTKTGRKRITNSPGTMCKLVCPTGFKSSGQYRLICGIDGVWEGNQDGVCVRSPTPIIKCPPDQTVTITKGSLGFVKIPAPRTSINWKFVESYPLWAKNLEGELPEGKHHILFTVTHPVTKLSSSCSFKIIVER